MCSLPCALCWASGACSPSFAARWASPPLAQLEPNLTLLHSLKLEDAKNHTFLETTFEIKNNKLKYWLKNDNEINKPTKIWRYADFPSQASFTQKKSVLMACLKKVQKMASDHKVMIESGIQKLAEFVKLGYPRKMIWTACTTMGVQTREKGWFEIREEMTS